MDRVPELIDAPDRLPLANAAPLLALRVEQVQKRAGHVALQTGAAMAVPILVMWLGIAMPLDWHFGLPRWVRALFLVLGLGGAGGVLWFRGLRHWWRRPHPDQVALAIERALPEFRSRFIASVQLARDREEHTHPLVKALVENTTELAHDLPFSRVVPTVRRSFWLKIATIACGVGALLWLAGGSASRPLLLRALLVDLPKPSNTQIVEFTGDRVVAAGDDLRLEATVVGVIPANGRLHIISERQGERQFSLDGDPSKRGRFVRMLQSVQEGFVYWLELGDTKTRRAEVRVRQRPTAVEIALEQRWPAYTGRPNEVRALSDLKLLAGSKLAVRLQPNVPLARASVHLSSPGEKSPTLVPLQMAAEAPAGNAPAAWSGVVPFIDPQVKGMTFQLADVEGVESKGMATYPVQVIPDQAPSVAVLLPERREELATGRATLLVAFEAKDDYGIARVKLHYGVNWAEGAQFKTVELDLGEETPRTLTRRFEWSLGRLNPPLVEGDVVDFWFEVLDNNDVTGPSVAALAQHYRIRIGSEGEKRADLAARLADTLEGLGGIRQSQQNLADRLGEFIYEKKPSN